MSDYTEFFLNSASNVVQLETIEISHPNFSKVYRVVRNATNGLTATIEDGTTQTFDYYPLKIEFTSQKEDLDQAFNISFGDLGEVLPFELDKVATANGFSTKPTVKYRTYRSDDLTKLLFGPIILEVVSFAFKRDGATFTAQAPDLTVNRTGEMYDMTRFPMLRGFI